MLFFIAILILVGFIIKIALPQLLPISILLHQYCLSSSPVTNWQEYYQAIVCSSPLTMTNKYQQLKDLGLLHIIVVSGSHLIFLSQALSLLNSKFIEKVKPLLLFIFVLIGRMDPPLLRAFLFLMIHWFQKRNKLFYSHYQTTLFSIVLCITISPLWIHSISLLLSWAASIGIHLGKNIYTKSFFCYITLAPLIVQFSSHSPLSILLNFSITPFVSLILFPASLLSFFVPISFVVDFIWDIFFSLCRTINDRAYIPSNLNISALKNSYQWLYLLLLNFILIELKKRRII